MTANSGTDETSEAQMEDLVAELRLGCIPTDTACQAADTIESLKSQLAEAQSTIVELRMANTVPRSRYDHVLVELAAEEKLHKEHKDKAIEVTNKLIDERDQAIKHNQRAWAAILQFFAAQEYGKGQTIDEVHQEYKASAIDEAIQALEAALSSKPIEGLVVVKDEPIYQVKNHANDRWHEVNRVDYDQLGEHGKRVVYSK